MNGQAQDSHVMTPFTTQDLFQARRQLAIKLSTSMF